MTIEELLAREAIRDRLARYNMAGDRMRIDDFVAVFAEDAVYESAGFRIAGRAAIAHWIAARGASGPSVAFVRHHLSTSQIDLLDEESADVRTYYHVFTELGPDHCGYYADRFERRGEDWLIARRKVRLDWADERSVFVTHRER